MASSVTLEEMRRLLDAVVDVGAGLDLPEILSRVVEAATELADAQYGALGVLDPTGTLLEDFITVGIDEGRRARIGSLPKGHGILGLIIDGDEPVRLDELSDHPAAYGFPPNHPPMGSFLGVPIRIRDRTFGDLYLTEKRGGGSFTESDEELVVGAGRRRRRGHRQRPPARPGGSPRPGRRPGPHRPRPPRHRDPAALRHRAGAPGRAGPLRRRPGGGGADGSRARWTTST